ncbi:DNA repair and recombination protein RAD54B [Pelomyxa schiedti]|nr:DNA repair and recombination protein RAD54B [Pelomyxa schiedti]
MATGTPPSTQGVQLPNEQSTTTPSPKLDETAPPCLLLLPWGDKSGASADVGDMALAVSRKYTWPRNQTLRYYFKEGPHCTAIQTQVVESAWKTWKDCNISLNFVRTETQEDAEIRISFVWANETGARIPGSSYSQVGTHCQTIPKTQETMNFGWDLQNYPHTALHEIGHALGFFHEHQHPFCNLKWNEQAVYDYYRRYNWDTAQVNRQILHSEDIEDVDWNHSSDWDSHSIMQYPFNHCLLRGPPSYMTTGIPENTTLSTIDKERVHNLYDPGSTSATTMQPGVPPIRNSTGLIMNIEASLFVGKCNPSQLLHICTQENALEWYQAGPDYQCIFITFMPTVDSGTTTPQFMDSQDGSVYLTRELKDSCFFRKEKAYRGRALLHLKSFDYMHLAQLSLKVNPAGDPAVATGQWEAFVGSVDEILLKQACGYGYVGIENGRVMLVPGPQNALKWYQVGPDHRCIFVTFVILNHGCYEARVLTGVSISKGPISATLGDSGDLSCVFQKENTTNGGFFLYSQTTMTYLHCDGPHTPITWESKRSRTIQQPFVTPFKVPPASESTNSNAPGSASSSLPSRSCSTHDVSTKTVGPTAPIIGGGAKKPFVTPFKTPFKSAVAPLQDDCTDSKTEPQLSGSNSTSTASVATTTTNSAPPTRKVATPAVLPRSTSSSPPSSVNTQSNSQKGAANSTAPGSGAVERGFSVMWCQYTTKKHKTMSDGYLSIKGNLWTLKDSDGKELGRSSTVSHKQLTSFLEGTLIQVFGKMIEFDSELEPQKIHDGSLFSEKASTVTPLVQAPVSVLRNSTLPKYAPRPPPIPMHDPNRPGAVVLDPGGDGKLPVVLDPYVAKKMRPHQIAGVKFMYECVVGKKDPSQHGCLLADEMGLGKTLQALALVWTLLKQGPHGPTIRKAVIVCPTTLIGTWTGEFTKWLGSERVIMAAMLNESTKEQVQQVITNFNLDVKPILVISYEQLRNHIAKLDITKVGLLICDEGHRLKNSASKTTQALYTMCNRRVILSGTPIQNDLGEFYTVVDFCCPGLLGPLPEFKVRFQKPIERSLVPNSTAEERQIGEECVKELTGILDPFILRRLSTILIDFLPPKTEHIILCKLTELQTNLYTHTLHSKKLASILSDSRSSKGLVCLQGLVKLCNHPQLLLPKDGAELPEMFAGITELLPPDMSNLEVNTLSSKMAVMDGILTSLKERTQDKVVIVSNYTKCLNVIELILQKRDIKWLRLDGSTPATARQGLVKSFNSPSSPFMVFLLSTKAGGVGLNLTGANRFILFDPGWNPAHDRQAIARVWRDGQKKPVFIYRLLSTGTIEEKIFQRQLAKQHLSSNLVADHLVERASFEPEFLHKIFTFNSTTLCDTHDAIGCQCINETSVSKPNADERARKYLSQLKHTPDVKTVGDTILSSLSAPVSKMISFVMWGGHSPQFPTT